MRDLTISFRIKRKRELKVRTWLAGKLIILAAMLLNCNLEMDVKRD